MKTYWIEDSIPYDGTQLCSLYAYLNHSVLGDSIVSWRGPCSISTKHMVDGEDLLAKATICGSDMIHFIVENFNSDIHLAVAHQRTLAHIIIEYLRKNSPNSSLTSQMVRKGDDLYIQEGKLNISIATQSPMSSLIHFGVNISNEGTPVKTSCLKDLEVNPQTFSLNIMKIFSEEVINMTRATKKVRWVK